MSPKLIFSLFLGVAGVSVATATTALSTNLFSSHEKCWYDDDKAGDFLEKVEEAVKEKLDDKKTLDLKSFIKSLCKLEHQDPLNKFNEKFGDGDYNDVFELLSKKWISLQQPQNQEKLN